MGLKIDLTGRRFGRLLVLCDSGRRDGSAVVWRCRCDCGREPEISSRDLLHRGTVSCGCLRREKSVTNLSGIISEKLGQEDGTNWSRIASNRAQKNNRSGYRGVSPQGSRWAAILWFRGARHRLGVYDTPEQAYDAYLTAKARICGDGIQSYAALRMTPAESEPAEDDAGMQGS